MLSLVCLQIANGDLEDHCVGPTNRLSVSSFSDASVSDCAWNIISLFDCGIDSGGTSTTVGRERFSPLATDTCVWVRMRTPSRPFTDSLNVWGTSDMFTIFKV